MKPAIALPAALLLLSACTTLEPAYERPSAPVPAAFPQGSAYGPGTPGAVAAADLPWRAVFLDTRLQGVIEQALANNRDLRIAAANVEQARALYRVQRSAQLPFVDAGASVTTTRSSDGQGGASAGERYTVDIGVSAFEIDLFGRLRSLSAAALQQFLATEEGARAVRISLIGETANAWLTLAADRELLRIARATQSAAEQSVTLNRQRLQGGVASQLEVSQAETVFQRARADAAAFETQVAQDRNALELLVGAPVADTQLPDRLEPGLVVADLPVGIGSEVLLRRPDVLQAENQLRAANANIGAARAAFYPRLSLTGSGGFASTALSSLLTGNAFTYALGPAVGLPIFDGGANRANLALSQAQRDAAVAQYERTIQVAFREVADALARRGTISEQVEATRSLADAAATGARLADARYREGIESFLASLEAQRTSYAAQQSLVGAELARQSNTVTVYRTLGGGLL
jgi:multidrug efflux system outer membrane protein